MKIKIAADNYNYYVEDESDLTDEWHDATYENREGSKGFVLAGTLNQIMEMVTQIRIPIIVIPIMIFLCVVNCRQQNIDHFFYIVKGCVAKTSGKPRNWKELISTAQGPDSDAEKIRKISLLTAVE